MLKFLRLAVPTVVAAAALCQPALAEPKFSFAGTPGELPKDVIPRHYSVRLTPNPQALTLQGSETIDIEVRKPTRTIVLNVLDLEVPRASLLDEKLAATVRVDNKKQTLTLTFPRPVKTGTHQLALDFRGKVNSTPEGLFYTRYQTPDGKQKQMFGSQMEPTDARRMFPMWDEPVYRSTFELTVTLPESYMGVSNMPIVAEKSLGNGLKSVRFGRTPAMASYLVVLCAGEFEALEDEVDGVKIRVVTTEGKKDTGRYALDVLKQIVPYYNDYFGVKYPLPKLDMIAIPGGFGGAMENWGGITYNESILLFNPAKSSQQTKEAVYGVVAHEVAHQWFGDLVTMAWWDNLWLNEGFASWMSAKATDHFNPGWQEWLRQSASKNYAMDTDARTSTHPIQQPVVNPAQAASAFDEITYQKGQAVIRMFEAYLSEDKFRAGIRSYMQAHKYSSTTTADLWEALGKSSGQPVGAVAASWTQQPGFPVVNVQTGCTDGKGTIDLTQERFMIDTTQPQPQRWQVPITYTRPADSQTVQTTLLTTKNARLDAPTCGESTKLNTGETGFYLVQYAPADRSQLLNQFASLPVADRLNLLADTWALVKGNRASSRDYLSLAEKVKDDTNPAVWQQVIGTVTGIDQLQVGQPGRSSFQEYGRKLIRPLFDRLGWDAKTGEPETDALLRTSAISVLGRFGDDEVIAEARQRFVAFLAEPASLAPNLRPAVFAVVGRYADQKTYDQLHELGRKADNTEEKQRYYRAMGNAQDPKLARQTLDLSLTDELEPGLASSLVTAVSSNGEHYELAWDFLKQNVKPLLAKQAFFSRYRYVPQVANVFNDADHARELLSFAKANLPAEAMPEVEKVVKRIEYRAELSKRTLPEVNAWACNQGVGGQTARFCLDVK